jgi:hypothetical protein
MYENTLTGQVVDGKVVLDPFNAEASSEPSAGPVADPADSFVAVNAPFDPSSVEVVSELEMEPVEA